MPWQFCPKCGCQLPPDPEPGAPAAAAPPIAAAKAPAAPPGTYDPVLAWKRILGNIDGLRARGAGVERGELVKRAVASAGMVLSGAHEPVPSIIHLAFDRNIVPSGGVLEQILMSGTRGPTPLMDTNRERLQLGGYVIGDDGHVKTVDDVPISRAYEALQYWGGERQHRRWHMSEPIRVVNSRRGDPFFMDDNMIAFGATWADGERLEEALTSLLQIFVKPPGDQEMIAVPLALEVVWR